MEFKNSLSILFSNMGYIFKVLLWVVICLIIIASIAAAILIPIGKSYSAEPQFQQAIQDVSDDVVHFVEGNMSLKTLGTELSTHLATLWDTIVSKTNALVGLVFLVILIYFLYSFLIGLSYYPMADIINKLMSTNMRFGFAAAMALNFKRSVKYSAAKMLVAFIVDCTILLIMIGLGTGLIKLMGLFALPLLLAVAVALCALRSTLFSGWLPRMLFNPEERVYVAFSRSLSSVKANFKGVFKAYVITFFMSYTLVVAFSLPTFGLMSVVVPSIYYFLLRSIELVGYYKTHSLCFYIDASNVINTLEYGYRSDNQNVDEDDQPSDENQMTIDDYPSEKE